MVECAPWADSGQIKKVTGDWHFVNEPVILSEIYREYADEFLKQPQDMNITRVLPELFEIVAGSEMKNKAREVLDRVHLNNEKQVRSVALRLIIHLIGDIHQPLHTSTLVNSNYSDGDLGGNNFKIDGNWNLHALWDARLVSDKSNIASMLNQVKLPFDDQAWLDLG